MKNQDRVKNGASRFPASSLLLGAKKNKRYSTSYKENWLLAVTVGRAMLTLPVGPFAENTQSGNMAAHIDQTRRRD